jgi:hypothetical protein
MSDATMACRRAGLTVILAAAMLAASGIASAQPSCTTQSEPERARCEQGQRVKKVCAGQTGEALAACRKKAIEPQTGRRDCTGLPEGYGRNKCEDENLRADIAARCGTKAGAEYDGCYAEMMAKAVSK